jgi:hypothetical protein
MKSVVTHEIETCNALDNPTLGSDIVPDLSHPLCQLSGSFVVVFFDVVQVLEPIVSHYLVLALGQRRQVGGCDIVIVVRIRGFWG